MPLKGFIDSKDAENIKLTTGNAKLYHTSKDSSENSEVINGVNTDAYYFSIEGENSQLYELDKSTLPKVVSKILPRPVNVEFIIPPKEYDGDMSIDLSTVAYRFKPTGSEDSGLVLGNQAHNNHGLSFEDIRIDKYDYSGGASVVTSQMHDTIRVMDEPGYKKQFWRFDTDYEKDYPELVYTLYGDEPDHYRYILEDKWMPYLGNRLDFNLYSQCRSRRIRSGDIYMETHDDEMSIVTSVKHTLNRRVGTSMIPLQVEPNSVITLTSQVDTNVWICGSNLIDNSALHVQIGPDIDTSNIGHFVSTDDLPEAGQYYYLTYQDQLVTVDLFAAMCGLSYVDMLSEGYAVIGMEGSGTIRASCPLRLGILKGNALYTLFSYGSSFSLISVPEAFLSGYLVVWKVNDSVDYKWTKMVAHRTGVPSVVNDFKVDRISVKKGVPFQYKIGNESIIHIKTEASYTNVDYTPGILYISDASGYLNLKFEEASHNNFTTFRKDVAKSDFLDLMTQVSSISYPDNVKFDEVTEMQINNPILTGNAAGNYKINSVYGISKIIPRRVTVSVTALSKVFDGNALMPTALTISNVIEGDDVLPNPSYFLVEAPFNRCGYWRSMLVENTSVPPLIGKDAYKYQLDKVEFVSSAEIHSLPAIIQGDEFIVHINDTVYNISNDSRVYVTLTNCLVDYNNNELSNVDAHVDPDQFATYVVTNNSSTRLVDAVRNMQVILSPDSETCIQISSTLFSDGDTISIRHIAPLIGKDSSSIAIEDESASYTVRIRHCN